jgi:hypothetical protein
LPQFSQVIVRDARTRETLLGGESVWEGSAPEGQLGIISKSGERLRLNKGNLVIPLGERTQKWRINAARLTADFIEKFANQGYHDGD